MNVPRKSKLNYQLPYGISRFAPPAGATIRSPKGWYFFHGNARNEIFTVYNLDMPNYVKMVYRIVR